MKPHQTLDTTVSAFIPSQGNHVLGINQAGTAAFVTKTFVTNSKTI